MPIEKIKIDHGPTLLDRLSLLIRDAFTHYKRFSIFFIPLFLVVFFLIFKFFGNKNSLQQEVVSAKLAYSKWDKSSSLGDESFKTLKSILKKRDELAPSYESLVVQKLLAFSQVSQAKPYIENILKRVGQKSSFYTKFSDVSILIAEGNYETALKRSIALKEEMISDQVFWSQQNGCQYGSVVFAFNLLRIAMLHQSLKDGESELVAWKDFKKYAGWDLSENGDLAVKIDVAAFQEILSQFTDKKISLKDYIKYREEKLLFEKNRSKTA